MYDIIIIGAGTAGIAAYKEAIKYTQNILIVNDGPWDTTCARVGCMPSKILIATANRMHDIKHAEELSLDVNASINTTHVMQHVQELRNRFTRATLRDVDHWEKSHKLSGKATFVDSNTIQVKNKKYQSKSFIIAVGSTPVINTDWKQILGDQLISSDDVFELQTLPKSLAVVGSGVIAIELAQAFQRLGVKTTIFARSQKVGSLSSPELQKLAQETLAKELDIKYQILPDQVKKFRNKVQITYSEQNQTKKINVDYILLATGRASYLNELKLSQIDSSFNNDRTLPIDNETKQLGTYPIFIVGDAYTQNPLQHEAAHAGRQVIQNCLNFPKIDKIKKLVPLGIMFSTPQMAGVGLNYKTLTERQIDFIIGSVSYTKQGRAIVNAQDQGAIELYVDKKTRKLLGAELFVYSAEHLAHLLAWSIAQDLTIDDILEQPFYHPTLEEGLRTALKHARRQIENSL